MGPPTMLQMQSLCSLLKATQTLPKFKSALLPVLSCTAYKICRHFKPHSFPEFCASRDGCVRRHSSCSHPRIARISMEASAEQLEGPDERVEAALRAAVGVQGRHLEAALHPALRGVEVAAAAARQSSSQSRPYLVTFGIFSQYTVRLPENIRHSAQYCRQSCTHL